MDIGNIALQNGYTGNYSPGIQFRSQQEHQLNSAELVDPISATRGLESDNSSPNNKHDAATSNNQYSVNSESEQKSTRSPSKNTNQENGNNPTTQLSEEDLKTVQELKQRDQEVRAHEAAHLAAAGKYATGGASFTYQRGPDGNSYAVGGEVGIDTSPVPNDPQATIQKAQQIKAAAQAPANPSSTDRQVAASATQMEAKARQEVSEQRLEESAGSSDTTDQSDSQQVGRHNSESESRSTKHIAASTYEAIDHISRTERVTISPIELTV